MPGLYFAAQWEGAIVSLVTSWSHSLSLTGLRPKLGTVHRPRHTAHWQGASVSRCHEFEMLLFGQKYSV